jgi:DNA-binding NtrC family response regulator
VTALERTVVTETELIQTAVVAAGGDLRQAAQSLGLHIVTLRAKIRRLGLSVPGASRPRSVSHEGPD